MLNHGANRCFVDTVDVKPKNRPPPPPLGNQRAKGNRGGTGRPPKFKPECVEIARLALLGGKTDEETAKLCGVALRTFQAWKATRPEFCASDWKKQAVKVVEASLYQRATGFVAPDVHVSSYEGQVTVTPIEKYIPPDTAAAKLFLEKQAPKEWGERENVDHRLVNISISFGSPVEQPKPAIDVSNTVSVEPKMINSPSENASPPSDSPSDGRQDGNEK